MRELLSQKAAWSLRSFFPIFLIQKFMHTLLKAQVYAHDWIFGKKVVFYLVRLVASYIFELALDREEKQGTSGLTNLSIVSFWPSLWSLMFVHQFYSILTRFDCLSTLERRGKKLSWVILKIDVELGANQ